MLRRFCDRIYSLRNTRISVRQQKILQDKITDLQKMYLAYITCFTYNLLCFAICTDTINDKKFGTRVVNLKRLIMMYLRCMVNFYLH